MQDMIERIVEMDKAAREITQKVKEEKLNLEQEIKELKKNIRDEYLERARKRIEINRDLEQKLANEKIESINNDQVKILEHLNECYVEKNDEWVETIVKNVLED
ncbi:MAG: hypothetical protein RUMPE_00312 [Eubacteriales bacterium SKADARSKE-1]|nr:hypothetical protein [Eubacteriales bacterium SKADARSKE-1]